MRLKEFRTVILPPTLNTAQEAYNSRDCSSMNFGYVAAKREWPEPSACYDGNCGDSTSQFLGDITGNNPVNPAILIIPRILRTILPLLPLTATCPSSTSEDTRAPRRGKYQPDGSQDTWVEPYQYIMPTFLHVSFCQRFTASKTKSKAVSIDPPFSLPRLVWK